VTVTEAQRRTTVHVSGEYAGYSFNSRDVPGFTVLPSAGERWVWFADMLGTQRVAQLWSSCPAGGTSQPGLPSQLSP
jgi:hypothetical protein